MSRYRAISIGVALVGILALAGAALAQETPAAAPPPDKSGFTLFDPTPASARIPTRATPIEIAR